MPLRLWVASSVAQPHENELAAAHKEMVELVHSFLGEQKDDLHQERFYATPSGMFENIWATVLLREDLDHSVQQWRACRLRPNAQPSTASEQ